MSSPATNDRSKFLRFYGNLELRVEQIGPHLWGGSVYAGCVSIPSAEGAETLVPIWQCFTDMTEDAAKRDAHATADKLIGPAPDGSESNWRNLSDVSEDVWSRPLVERHFPGYPEREGVERWNGF